MTTDVVGAAVTVSIALFAVATCALAISLLLTGARTRRQVPGPCPFCAVDSGKPQAGPPEDQGQLWRRRAHAMLRASSDALSRVEALTREIDEKDRVIAQLRSDLSSKAPPS